MTALCGWCTSPSATANPPFQSRQAQLESGVRGNVPAPFGAGERLQSSTYRYPAAHGVRGHRDAMCGLERQSARGTTPPGAAPARGPWGFFAQGTERAREPRPQDGGLDSHRELALCGDPYAKAPCTIGVDKTGHAGARAAQTGRNLRGVSAHCTPQEAMERAQRTLAGTAEDGAPLGLFCQGHLPEGSGRHRGRLLATWMSEQLQRITQAPHGANVVWPDLDKIKNYNGLLTRP
jgi:hypothetical protein